MTARAAAVLPSAVLAPVSSRARFPDTSSRRWRWLRRRGIVLAGMVAIAIGLRLTYFRPAAVPVTVTTVDIGRVEELVTNNKAGTVNARRRASVSPEIGGVIVRRPVNEGDVVRKGQILIALADSDLRAQVALQQRALDTARSTVTEACAAADLATRTLERTRRLAQDGLVSRQTLDQTESQGVTSAAACTSARARLEQAEASVDVAQVTLVKSVLRAPFDAVVSRVSAEIGEWVSPSPVGVPVRRRSSNSSIRVLCTFAPRSTKWMPDGCERDSRSASRWTRMQAGRFQDASPPSAASCRKRSSRTAPSTSMWNSTMLRSAERCCLGPRPMSRSSCGPETMYRASRLPPFCRATTCWS